MTRIMSLNLWEADQIHKKLVAAYKAIKAAKRSHDDMSRRLQEASTAAFIAIGEFEDELAKLVTETKTEGVFQFITIEDEEKEVQE